MKNKRSKKASALITRKAGIIATAVLCSIVTFAFFAYLFYMTLMAGYHNDAINTLYTVTGKCTNVVWKTTRRTYRTISQTYVIFTIDGIEYSLNADYIEENSDTFNKKVLAAEAITLKYVVALDGDAVAQSMEIPGDKEYVRLEMVVKRNYLNSNIGFVACLVFCSMANIIIFFPLDYYLGKVPSIKKALRKEKRKKDRAVQFGKIDRK